MASATINPSNLNLSMATTKKYWKGIEELQNDAAVQELAKNEFPEEVATADFLGDEKVSDTKTTRRDFLKFMGFSTAAATLAACETPVQKVIPYVVKPEEVTPGVANYYATTYSDGEDFASVLVKTREGRPIKIETNNDAPMNGAMTSRVQASVLNLYDTARAKAPMKDGAEITWATVDADIKKAIADAEAAGKKVIFLTNSITSPSINAVGAEFMTMHPGASHVSYDAVSYSRILDAHSEVFGKRALPSYHFDKAEVVVGVGADFLGEHLNFGNSRDYIKMRDPRHGKMSRHWQFESNMSITGANADKRVMVKPSEQGKVILSLYNALAAKSGNPAVGSTKTAYDADVNAVANKLWAARGKSLVVAGSNDADVQKVTIAINQILGNYGATLDIDRANKTKQGNDAEVATLLADMKAGQVGVLVMMGVNPVYSHAMGAEFAEAMKKVDTTAVMDDRMTETAISANYLLPTNHYLESWDDAMPVEGYYTLAQPTIQKLYDTRSPLENMLAWTGKGAAYDFIKNHWGQNILVAGAGSWNRAVHDGFYVQPQSAGENTESKEAPVLADVSGAARAIAQQKGSDLELELYTKSGLGSGASANNPWLQEFPDPITRTSWDNYLTVSRTDVEAMGLVNENTSNGALNGSLVNVTVNGTTVENVPVMIQPGQAPGSVGLALGYGRTAAGIVGNGVGVNAFPLYLNGSTTQTGVTIEKVDGMHEFACIQLAHTMMGRHIVKETTLEEFIANPSAGNDEPTFETHEGVKPASEVNLWEEFDKTTGHWWNLSIDLNNCIACGACVVACQAENNVPVVGKDEIRRSRDMHWLRIDRYYSSEMTKDRAEEEGLGAIDMYAAMEDPADAPEVVFQPVMCQHCNHAPCETVCPVGATAHSSEGLNHMAYNRCIGTRYCANNCPYKVRRFNWFNYPTYSKFNDVNPAQDEWGKMVLNPDVTVRARGVMEKCTMCLQRIQLGKLEAKREGRPVADGDFTVACAGACDTGAITFGDVNDPESRVHKLREEPRRYYLLEEIGTKPSVFYQTKVRNKA